MRIEFDDGAWVELREATFGDIRHITKLGGAELDQTAALLQRIITAWSYDRAIDEAGIDALPLTAISKLSEHLGGMGTTKEESLPLDSGSTSNSSVSTNTVKELATLAQRT